MPQYSSLLSRRQDAHRCADAAPKQDPWPPYPKEGEIDLTHMSRKVKEVIRAAGLCDELILHHSGTAGSPRWVTPN
jgi:hypothetical protein